MRLGDDGTWHCLTQDIKGDNPPLTISNDKVVRETDWMWETGLSTDLTLMAQCIWIIDRIVDGRVTEMATEMTIEETGARRRWSYLR